jgi:hypothetical protein
MALAASMPASYAGPCSQQIDAVQAAIDAKLEATAAAKPSARETTAATMHRQPTPGLDRSRRVKRANEALE